MQDNIESKTLVLLQDKLFKSHRIYFITRFSQYPVDNILIFQNLQSINEINYVTVFVIDSMHVNKFRIFTVFLLLLLERIKKALTCSVYTC